jgi:hypothetical protein
MRAQINAGKCGDSEKLSLLQRLMKYQYSVTQPMPDHDIISESIGHMYVDGSDQIVVPNIFYQDGRNGHYIDYDHIPSLGTQPPTRHHEKASG